MMMSTGVTMMIMMLLLQMMMMIMAGEEMMMMTMIAHSLNHTECHFQALRGRQIEVLRVKFF